MSEKPCKVCGAEMHRISVACPDNIPGCCVAHSRLICPLCARKKEDEQFGGAIVYFQEADHD